MVPPATPVELISKLCPVIASRNRAPVEPAMPICALVEEPQLPLRERKLNVVSLQIRTFAAAPTLTTKFELFAGVKVMAPPAAMEMAVLLKLLSDDFWIRLKEPSVEAFGPNDT